MSLVSPANQHTPDVREQKCWDFYIGSIVKGTDNAYQAAIDAKYSRDHARNITMQGWFKARLAGLKRKGIYSKGERNLDEMLDADWKPQGEIKPEIMRIVADISKVVVRTLGKDDGWSDRTEITGGGGGAVNVNIVAYADNNSAISIPATPLPVAIIEGD